MTRTLQTPLTHRLIESPLGRLLYTPAFERVKLSAIGSEFTVLRARAAADVAGGRVDRFLAEVGADVELDPSTTRRLRTALDEHAETRAAFEVAREAWVDAVWDGEGTPLESRTELDARLREAGERWIRPNDTFGFLVGIEGIDPVAFDVPDPATTLETWGDREATAVYGPPATAPGVERSATVHGPGTREYLVRFPSPSPYVDDTAMARVYEPFAADSDAELSTLVFGTGLAMACDLLEYWTEEEYVGRALARRGHRVVLPIPPWHGRREVPGYYSGERYLARMPESAVELYATQTRELAVLTEWARSTGAPAVGVGGISLGGIVTTFLASYADELPSAQRPDFVVPVAPSARVDDLLLGSSLVERLGVGDALTAAGWTPETVDRLGHLLRAPSSPGLDPARIYLVGGRRDEMTQYRPTKAVFERWGVPAENVLEWDCGHFGVLLRTMRTREFQQLLTTALDEASARARRVMG